MNPEGGIRELGKAEDLVPGEIELTAAEKAVLDQYKPAYRLEILRRIRAGIFRIRPGRGGKPELAVDTTRQQRRAEKSKKARRRIAAASRRANR